jgi:hypothetical protein
MIINWLGVSNNVMIDALTTAVQPGDVILLCSDSVWARSADLLAALCRPAIAAADVERLVADSAARDRHDATVVAIALSD